jgi:hypothetical protein
MNQELNRTLKWAEKGIEYEIYFINKQIEEIEKKEFYYGKSDMLRELKIHKEWLSDELYSIIKSGGKNEIY